MTKATKITKKEYENILNDNTKKLTVKRIKKGLEVKECVFEGTNVIAERIITSNGVEYFKYF